MALVSNLVLKILKYGEIIYLRLRKKYLKFLPTSPLSSFPIFRKDIFELRTKSISGNFDPIIQDHLKWYIKYHYDIEDSQDPIDVANLCKFIMETENLDGDILELGSERAGLTIILAEFLKKIGSKKVIYGCDTFEGYPYDDKYSFTKFKKGMMSGFDYNIVLDRIKKFNVTDRIILLKGMFEETLYQKIPDKKFSLVFVDCNLYDSTKIGLEFSYPRVSKGGVIAFDEYEDKVKGEAYFGETKATDEFCETNKIKINLTPIPHIRV